MQEHRLRSRPDNDRHRHWKNIFHIVGFDADGKIALRRKIKRSALAYTRSAREKVPQFLDWRLPIPGS
jgi:hypothetical protein